MHTQQFDETGYSAASRLHMSPIDLFLHLEAADTKVILIEELGEICIRVAAESTEAARN